MQVRFETKNEFDEVLQVEARVFIDRMEGMIVEIESVEGSDDFNMDQIEGEAQDAYYQERSYAF